jgi:hypothetical protein
VRKLEKVVNSRQISEEKLVFAQSEKGREMLLNGGHKYVLVLSRNGIKTWRCNGAKKYGCKAGATTIGNNFSSSRSHNHPRLDFPVKVLKMKKM